MIFIANVRQIWAGKDVTMVSIVAPILAKMEAFAKKAPQDLFANVEDSLEFIVMLISMNA